MIESITRNWWLVALRGLVAILFGLAAFVRPGMTLTALAYLFGASARAGGPRLDRPGRAAGGLPAGGRAFGALGDRRVRADLRRPADRAGLPPAQLRARPRRDHWLMPADAGPDGVAAGGRAVNAADRGCSAAPHRAL